MVIGIDKDCSQGRVYWSDISSRQILSAKYDGTDKKTFIQEGKFIEQKIHQRHLFQRNSEENEFNVIFMNFRHPFAGRCGRGLDLPPFVLDRFD